jgi:hypothetical protein
LHREKLTGKLKPEREVMSETVIENIIRQISQLPTDQQRELRRLLEEQAQTMPALDKRVPPRLVPDSEREMKWLREHSREYANQWVALDGDRLIAHGATAHEVYAAAAADGAHLPMVTFIEDPDAVSILF